MDETLISSFIDDEMDLDEKIIFVKTVHTNREFTRETVALLAQEKMLREIPHRMPATVIAGLQAKPAFTWSGFCRAWWQPVTGFVAAMLLAGFAFLLQPGQSPVVAQVEQRFVLYLPQVGQAKIVGTFTGWNPVPMHKIGSSGYWSLSLKVPPGEHRYSYLVEEGNRIVDPTVVAREHDDFGGENSVLIVGGDDVPVS
jgi:hypothetical protein